MAYCNNQMHAGMNETIYRNATEMDYYTGQAQKAQTMALLYHIGLWIGGWPAFESARTPPVPESQTYMEYKTRELYRGLQSFGRIGP